MHHNKKSTMVKPNGGRFRDSLHIYIQKLVDKLKSTMGDMHMEVVDNLT